MIEVSVAKDMRKFEPKFMMGLTFRQFIFTLIGAAIALLLYNIQKTWTDVPNTTLCSVAIFPMMFGFIKPYEMTLEKYLKVCFMNNFIYPKTRIQKSDNYFKQFTTSDPIDAGKEYISDKGKPYTPNFKKERKQLEKINEEFKPFK